MSLLTVINPYSMVVFFYTEIVFSPMEVQRTHIQLCVSIKLGELGVSYALSEVC